MIQNIVNDLVHGLTELILVANEESKFWSQSSEILLRSPLTEKEELWDYENGYTNIQGYLNCFIPSRDGMTKQVELANDTPKEERGIKQFTRNRSFFFEWLVRKILPKFTILRKT